MGIATLRAGAKGNRSRISRFFASFALLVVAASGIAISFAPQTASAAEQWNWVNDSRIDVTGLTSPWGKDGGPFVDNNGKVLTFTFTDSNPNDTNRTFRQNDPKNTYGYCKDGNQNTLRMRTPGSGDYTFITTEVPTDYIYNHNIRVTCKTETRSVSVGSTSNGQKTTRTCPENSQLDQCLAQQEQGNAAWIRRCGYLDAGSGVPTNTPEFCQNTQTPPNDPGANTGDTGENASASEIDECAALGDFSMRWIACPLLTASIKTVSALDKLLEEYLHYDTQIFDRKTDKGKNFYAAWSTFRGIALALVLVAGLVMVVSQGTGMQLFDAYTVKKVMPRLLIAVIGITLSWPILQFVITFFNDTGHWIQDIILMPFQSVAQSTGDKGVAEGFGAATILITAFFGTATYAFFLGPIGILSLVGTVMLALLVGFVVLIIRSVVITIAVIFAPLAIACYILPNTKKVWDFWQNAITTALTIFPIIMALLAAGKALSLVTDEGLMKVLFVVAPYFFLPFAFKLAGGLMSTIFSITNDRGRGAFDRLRNARQNQMKMRSEKWREGTLYRDNAFTRQINQVGRRVGAYQSGAGLSAFSGGARGRKALAYYDGVVGDKALKRNEILGFLQNDDDANAVLGMSGGSLAGAEQAARDLFTDENGVYNEARGRAAINGARAAGINRTNALAAAKTTMLNKARAFEAGNVRALDRGVRRLARNDDEYTNLGHTLAFFARDKGRADLGGTDWIDYGQQGAVWQAARAAAPGDEMRQWQHVADRNMYNGLRRTGMHAMMTGHTNQATQTMETLVRTLNTAPIGSDARLEAAIGIKEMQGNISSASGDVRDAINRVLYAPAANGGLGLNSQGNISEQLASMVGIEGLRGQDITTRGRTWQEYVNESQGGRRATPEEEEAFRRQMGGEG